MADFYFTVDTSSMAAEMQHVSRNVNKVSGAVVAMQTAVIAAEQASAENICQNLNKGFYSLMYSQISQKIAQLTSVVEAKLLELGQYSAALQSLQSRMTADYNMISGRYTKLFQSINNTMETRASELDMPVFQLVDRDMKLFDNRVHLNTGQFTANQLESILSAQMLAASKVKLDADTTLDSITKYLKEANAEAQKTNAPMQDAKIESAEEIYVPVCIVESSSVVGNFAVNYYFAESGNPSIDKRIDASVREQAVNSVLKGSWSEMDQHDKMSIESEFNKLLANANLDERVKQEIAKLFNGMNDVQQLNPEGYGV